MDVLMSILSVGSIIILLCIAAPLFIIFVIPLGILYWLIQRYYIKTSRELRKNKN